MDKIKLLSSSILFFLLFFGTGNSMFCEGSCNIDDDCPCVESYNANCNYDTCCPNPGEKCCVYTECPTCTCKTCSDKDNDCIGCLEYEILDVTPCGYCKSTGKCLMGSSSGSSDNSCSGDDWAWYSSNCVYIPTTTITTTSTITTTTTSTTIIGTTTTVTSGSTTTLGPTTTTEPPLIPITFDPDQDDIIRCSSPSVRSFMDEYNSYRDIISSVIQSSDLSTRTGRESNAVKLIGSVISYESSWNTNALRCERSYECPPDYTGPCYGPWNVLVNRLGCQSVGCDQLISSPQGTMHKVSCSYGLIQMMYPTAWGRGYRGPPEGLWNPETNINFCTDYLLDYIERCNSIEEGLNAYNLGGTCASRYEHPYANAVFDWYNQWLECDTPARGLMASIIPSTNEPTSTETFSMNFYSNDLNPGSLAIITGPIEDLIIERVSASSSVEINPESSGELVTRTIILDPVYIENTITNIV